MILTCVTIVLDHPIIKSSYTSTWLGQHSLLLLMCSSLLMPQVSATMVSLPAILVPWSKLQIHPSPFPIYGMTCLYLTFSITVDRLCASHMLWLVINSIEAWSSSDNHSSSTQRTRASCVHNIYILSTNVKHFFKCDWLFYFTGRNIA
jgi:hypothetical protein